jgi:hypothetical protein
MDLRDQFSGMGLAVNKTDSRPRVMDQDPDQFTSGKSGPADQSHTDCSWFRTRAIIFLML